MDSCWHTKLTKVVDNELGHKGGVDDQTLRDYSRGYSVAGLWSVDRFIKSDTNFVTTILKMDMIQ